MPSRDAYGLEVSTSSRAAVDDYDQGVRTLLGFGADAIDRFRGALTHVLHAFARGEYAAAAGTIAPIEARIVDMGGSHAQRELFHDTLLAAALRADLEDIAATLLARRPAKRPSPGHYWTTVRPAAGPGARERGMR